jgi:Ca2+-transporting ATPase
LLSLFLFAKIFRKMGHVASLLANTEQGDTPLQIRLHQLGSWLGIASLVMSSVVFIVGAATGMLVFFL